MKERVDPLNMVPPVTTQIKQDSTTTGANYAVKEKAASAVTNQDLDRTSDEVTVEGKSPPQDITHTAQAVQQESEIVMDQKPTQAVPKPVQTPSLISNPRKMSMPRQPQNQPLSKRGQKVRKPCLSTRGVGGLRPCKTPSVDAQTIVSVFMCMC